jgi:hypothetical protein
LKPISGTDRVPLRAPVVGLILRGEFNQLAGL